MKSYIVTHAAAVPFFFFSIPCTLFTGIYGLYFLGYLLSQSPLVRKPLPRVRKPNLHSDRGQDSNPMRLETPRTPKRSWFHCTTAASYIVENIRMYSNGVAAGKLQHFIRIVAEESTDLKSLNWPRLEGFCQSLALIFFLPSIAVPRPRMPASSPGAAHGLWLAWLAGLAGLAGLAARHKGAWMVIK
ncbi:hypothetical protein E2C01_035133 [Portunus trituberculatus]|uniref:Uncharacterized protein n=1 Tax=Portunus trituberculatus TaxID=210409 RepID=A0A5B7FAM4_PORTR|nr:hypothetical protein [Portunus trituberculatus]